MKPKQIAELVCPECRGIGLHARRCSLEGVTGKKLRQARLTYVVPDDLAGIVAARSYEGVGGDG